MRHSSREGLALRALLPVFSADAANPLGTLERISATLYPVEMIPLFLGLSIANMTALLATITLGYAAAGGSSAMRGWHMLAGAMTALLCIAVHCVVFTYFMATAKWIRHAVTVKGLDAAFLEPTRSFKAQAFPAALGAIAAVFIAAIFGAATDNHMVASGWHHGMALLAVGVNLAAAVFEYGAISRNSRLIDQICSESSL